MTGEKSIILLFFGILAKIWRSPWRHTFFFEGHTLGNGQELSVQTLNLNKGKKTDVFKRCSGGREVDAGKPPGFNTCS